MAATPSLHVLDVGTKIYGDSIVIRSGNSTILIDGAHPGDEELLTGQMAEILGHDAPFPIDLLVVTHCHGDHIGCLPGLVEQGIVEIRSALVADETLGFGQASDAPVGDAARLFAALREEPLFTSDSAELAAFIDAAVKLEPAYRGMLAALEQAGVPVIRYTGQSLSALENKFSSFGLQILGPTRAHLQKCADEIERLKALAARNSPGGGDADTVISAYRRLVSTSEDALPAEDRPGKGAALNDQSIVLKMTLNGHAVLLTGDQQFAMAEISGLTSMMRALRDRVKAAGPYKVVKEAHHGSYNGVDASVLDDHGAKILLFSGGSNDTGHPDGGVLELLQENTSTLRWARTDKNGRIDVAFPAAAPRVTKSKGRFNDSDPNPGRDVAVPPAVGVARAPVAERVPATNGMVEFSGTVRLPPDVSRVQITIDVQRHGGAPAAPRAATKEEPNESEDPAGLPPGLPAKLLFVTNASALRAKVGPAATRALDLIKARGFDLLDLPASATPWKTVQAKLRQGNYEGVTLLGGYDVIPAGRMDVIGPALRAELSAEDIAADSDQFVVWSDDVYGDIEGDQDPELAVSRVPDAGDGAFFLRCLAPPQPPPQPIWGLRNDARPFANAIQRARRNAADMLASAPTGPGDVQSSAIEQGSLYFMLHGADYDTTRFWGEKQGSLFDAFEIARIPSRFSGTVFTGCCYGALLAQPAARMNNGTTVRSKRLGESIALQFLAAGSRAYIGCTGTHYSPSQAPYRFFGGPFHSAFFKSYDGGKPPAKALLEAKREFARGLPHGMDTPAGQAVELKILRLFTCLGLGW